MKVKSGSVTFASQPSAFWYSARMSNNMFKFYDKCNNGQRCPGFRIFAVSIGILKCLVALQYKQLDHFHLLPPFSMKARVKGKSFRIQKNFFSLCNAPGILLFQKNSRVCKREVAKLLGKNWCVPNLLKSTSVLKKRRKKEKFGHSLAL